ncbi:hypothetical protein EGJ86_19215 [Pseudomonas sp. o96-267]|uniref:hypothetical protein n=1 Tax=Pseudomonas sp. o96-267 TaxID=2479853 RepID=UPI000F7B1C49|nr:MULTISPECIES: hypothetical protein [Pseudomonas]MDH0959102.1 hypothetical protein [Pseudomonas chengduensis]MDV5863589.1 hypothetical protein [Pseudomonas mendocina]RRV31703.1 hypothetical protein EGJ86_19215 [Pseudomonas sp. o96-267]
MSRRALASVASDQEVAVPYQVSLSPEVAEAVRTSIDHSKQSWPEWVDLAISRLMRESKEERENLLADPKPGSRSGKQTLSFRIYPSTLQQIRQLAKENRSNMHTVLSHAFFMHALSTDLSA